MFTVPGTDAQQAVDLLSARFPAQNLPTAQVVFHARTGTLASATLTQASAALEALPKVRSVAPAQVSGDGTIAVLNVVYSVPFADLPRNAVTALERATRPARAAGVTVDYGGPVVDLLSQQSSASDHADEVGLAFAVVILLFVFGTVVAAALPLTTAVIGVSIATAILTLVATVMTVGTVAPILGTMIGLGVGIDYSLLVVSRFRQNRVEGMDVETAIGSALGTAGAASLFAGCCVAVAMCGLWFAGIPYVSMLGFSAALFVAVMVIASLTLLPALLGVLGPHLDRLRVLPGRSGGNETRGVWYRWGHEVARRAWWFLIASLLVLLALAVPVLRMQLGFADDGDDPPSFTQRRAYDLVTQGFGPGANGPLLLAISLPKPTAAREAPDLAAVEKLLAAVAATRGVASVTPPVPSLAGDAAVALVVPRGTPNSDATQALVRRLRGRVIPTATAGTVLAGSVHVGGQTAELIDLTDRIDDRLLWCIGAVVVGAFVILMMVFRSVLVPLKAAVMNLLSIGAAYGVVVAVFQWGWGMELIGLHQTVPIVAFVPLMMFAILFGLSMDYEVFLLARIREEYLASGDNREAVAMGIAKTARVITSAALIMIAVFLSFVTSPQPVVKMIGLGLAVAVAVDATIVRLMLVPATMELLGDANWWFPKTLDRLLPHIELDGPEPRPAPVATPELEPALTR